jgi:subtilisin family serine protease
VVVTDESGGGRFDGWVTTDAGHISDGDSSSTIDEPGNARGVITVGAWNSKAAWPSKLGEQDESDEIELGSLSEFSSQGPTRDGRTKPDLAAPGTWICAALSSSAVAFEDLTHPDGVHVMHRGTSMAAPHVTGTIALLFDVDPQLASADVAELLTSTAVRDSYTGSAPNVRWGYGKLDAWAALLEVGVAEPPTPSGPRPTVSVAKNPAVDEVVFAYALPGGTRAASLHVYDVAGRRVFEVPLSVGASDYIWDLVSNGGERVAAGLYLYVIASDRGSSGVGRLVISP